VAVLGIPLSSPLYRPFHLASDIRHLFAEGKRIPSPPGQIFVLDIHQISIS
jgi:hypothetical protein